MPPGGWVGMRRPLTGEVGGEEKTVDARAPRLGLGRRGLRTTTSGASRSRSHCSDPAAESITPIACH